MIDVVCAGTVFLDITFEGLEALPGPGEERFAHDLHTTPGGAAITAIGLVRLGLSAAVVAPLGRDLAGTMLRGRLEAEGVVCGGPTEGRTPVAAVLPVGHERAFATFEPPALIEPAAVERLRPRAVVVGFDRLHLAPAGAALYVSAGDRDADRFALRMPEGLPRARAVLVNRSEALRLTGERDAEGAALALAESAETAVVTCGADGAVAVAAGDVVGVSAPRVEPQDTTGAGDLFVAAYVWGDLAGLPLEERVRRAAVYAALSVRTVTGAGSAATLDELERTLAELDPAIVQE
jgi:sugar/nucleoside kinase (ribokinase family)